MNTSSRSSSSGIDVTVVVPALDAAATVGRQLTALRDQSTDRGVEVVVADNGSTDGTRAVVDSFRRSWPALRAGREVRMASPEGLAIFS